MKIHLLTAEHFRVPGLIVKAFMTHQDAVREAIDLTNLMLKDNGNQPLASPIQWRHHVERLQDEHGAAHCYVEIAEIDVEGADAHLELEDIEAMLAEERDKTARRLQGVTTAMTAKLQEAIDEWPQFDVDETAEDFDPNGDQWSEVNGGDLVEWFGIWREQVKALLTENGGANDQ